MKKTIKDVARLAGVSVGTASKVMNKQGNVKKNLREKVLKAAVDLNYRANGIARSLRNASSYTIAVLLGDITNPFQMMLARGIEEVFYEHGYHLLISSTREDPEIEIENLKMLDEKRVDGIILCTTGKANDELRSLLMANMPIVVVDRPIFSLPVDVIADDNLLGMELLVKHLYELGHRRIGVINGNKDTIHGQIRYQGVVKAFEKFNLNLEPELQVEGSFSYESGYQATNYFLQMDQAPTAILSANNNITAGILRACRDLNVHIPNDVSIVGFGDLEYTWNLITPTVTVVTQSPLTIGHQAAELILKRLLNKEAETRTHSFIAPELVIRESSSAIR